MAKTKINLKVRIPHILVDTRGASAELVEALASGLEHLNARIRILGDGANTLPHSFSAEEALEEADIWLILGDTIPSEFNLLMEHGIVPVMQEGLHKSASNYLAAKERGNAFLFNEKNEWHIYASLVRALENFAFSYDWKNLKKQLGQLMV
jgi:hypothetical protein